MNEEQGNLIDGTARASQWRRSRLRSSAANSGGEQYSDAPRSMASSLFMPGEMPAPGIGGTDGAGDVSAATAEHVNPFLSPDAAGEGDASADPRDTAATGAVGWLALLELPWRCWPRLRPGDSSSSSRPHRSTALRARPADSVNEAHPRVRGSALLAAAASPFAVGSAMHRPVEHPRARPPTVALRRHRRAGPPVPQPFGLDIRSRLERPETAARDHDVLRARL